jgi:actin-related protein
MLDKRVTIFSRFRRHLAKNIILIGGTTMITGFKARLFQVIYFALVA